MPGETQTLRFMILDDEAIIAIDLAEMLQGLGHSVVSIANRVSGAMEFALHGDFDMAILDINVHGAVSFPLAEVLQSRGVPFIFASGYGERGLIEGFRDAFVLTKPFGVGELNNMVEKASMRTA